MHGDLWKINRDWMKKRGSQETFLNSVRCNGRADPGPGYGPGNCSADCRDDARGWGMNGYLILRFKIIFLGDLRRITYNNIENFNDVII